jgi:DsbC/DsbD-like thiol-disulfide interchange protein
VNSAWPSAFSTQHSAFRLLAAGALSLSVYGVSTAQSPPASSRVETPHLAISTSATPLPSAGRSTLTVDVVPKPEIHVYAPAEKEAIPIALTLSPEDGVKAASPVFPAAEKFFFAPLKLTQLVYSKPFRITQDVTVSPAAAQRVRQTGGTLVVKGTLRYQACDDKVCYVPKSVPLSWTLSLKSDR